MVECQVERLPDLSLVHPIKATVEMLAEGFLATCDFSCGAGEGYSVREALDDLAWNLQRHFYLLSDRHGCLPAHLACELARLREMVADEEAQRAP